jgi:RHS repeat-associated protein
LTTCARAGGCAGSRYPFLTLKERDVETGLDYFESRYYASSQGRFISADEPFADQDEDQPQSWNLYSYVRNNPLRYIDPFGDARWEVGKDGLEHYIGDEIGEYDKDLNATWDGTKWNFHDDNGQDNVVIAEPEPVQSEAVEMGAAAIAIGLTPPPVKLGLVIGGAAGTLVVGGVILLHQPGILEVAPPTLTSPTFVKPSKIQIGPAPPPPPILKKKGEKRQIRAAARAVGVNYIALRNAIHKFKRDMKMRGNENLDWETLIAIAEEIKRRLEK